MRNWVHHSGRDAKQYQPTTRPFIFLWQKRARDDERMIKTSDYSLQRHIERDFPKEFFTDFVISC